MHDDRGKLLADILCLTGRNIRYARREIGKVEVNKANDSKRESLKAHSRESNPEFRNRDCLMYHEPRRGRFTTTGLVIMVENEGRKTRILSDALYDYQSRTFDYVAPCHFDGDEEGCRHRRGGRTSHSQNICYLVGLVIHRSQTARPRLAGADWIPYPGESYIGLARRALVVEAFPCVEVCLHRMPRRLYRIRTRPCILVPRMRQKGEEALAVAEHTHSAGSNL